VRHTIRLCRPPRALEVPAVAPETGPELDAAVQDLPHAAWLAVRDWMIRNTAPGVEPWALTDSQARRCWAEAAEPFAATLRRADPFPF